MPRADAATHPPSDISRLRVALCEALADELFLIAEAQKTVEVLTGQQDSDSILEREIAERRWTRGLESVADIETALERIEAGTYGVCERCGGLIAIERLEAIPFARLCVICTASSPSLLD
jgi:RNA polymerase-binding transcription factor DksA